MSTSALFSEGQTMLIAQHSSISYFKGQNLTKLNFNDISQMTTIPVGYLKRKETRQKGSVGLYQ